MFDTTKGFTIKLPPLGLESVDVRWPTDAEWCDRAKKLRVARTSLGRGKFKTEAVRPEIAGRELFSKIHQNENGGSDVDDVEASYVIDRLEVCEVSSVELDGNQFVIGIDAHGAKTEHRVRAPRLKAITDYRRENFEETIGRNRTEFRARLEPAGVLYDAIHEEHSGYADGTAVPIVHKQAVVDAVLEDIDRRMSPDPED